MTKTYLREVYERKSLIWSFAVTDLKLRYRNSVLGFLWSVLEPLFMLTVLYVIFSYVLRSNVENFALFLLLGIILWNTFSRGTSGSSNSMLGRGGLILTIYFPRIILPISSTITSFLMLFFEFLVFAGFLIAFQFLPAWTVVFLPLSLIPLFLITMGMGFFLSVLNVMYRDVGYIWAVILQAGFFLTPIIYRLDIFPESIQNILLINPMAHVVIWAQDAVLFNKMPVIESLSYTFGISISIFLIGYFVFRKFDGRMVDKI